MTKAPQPQLVPHQVEILKVLSRETMPLSRPELYEQLSFKNWLGKYLGTPRSRGKYPNSLLELGLVDVEDESGAPDDKGRNCLFFFTTRLGLQVLKQLASRNGKAKPAPVDVPKKRRPKKQRFNRPELEAMPRKALRILAKEHHVSTTGTKMQMIDRFMSL